MTTFSPRRDGADEPLYAVRVVAERLGIPTATLRSWNQRYGVGPSDHRPGSHRLYSENDIAIVKRMHELIAQGASPRSAARAATDGIRPARGNAPGLLAAAFDLDVVTVGLLLDRHLRHFGVVATWDELIRPAFAVIVDRQAEGEECVDVEHTLSWAVSRSLHRLPIGEPDATESIVLSCTPRETHTLALEALRAALAEYGYGALMLGAEVPTTAIIDAVNRRDKPVIVVLWSQHAPTADIDTVNAVAEYARSVVLCGLGWDGVACDHAVLRPDSLDDAVKVLTTEH